MVFIPETGTPAFANWRKRRSVLFMPASNARALQKAASLSCDGVIFDLEDAVSGSEQDGARANIEELVKDRDFGGKETMVRVSAFGDTNFRDDMVVALEAGVDCVLLPKVETVDVVETVADAIAGAGQGSVKLWAMIETPLALMNLGELARCGHLAGFVVGPNDLAKETGAAMAPGRAAMVPWLSMTVAAARAYGLCVLDGVYNRFTDEAGLVEECQQGAAMGFDGKTLIHPKQIEAANAAFSPSAAEMEKARAIIALFSRPEHADKGAVQLEGGEMVERLHLSMAEKLVAAFASEEK